MFHFLQQMVVTRRSSSRTSPKPATPAKSKSETIAKTPRRSRRLSGQEPAESAETPVAALPTIDEQKVDQNFAIDIAEKVAANSEEEIAILEESKGLQGKFLFLYDFCVLLLLYYEFGD